jgi:hypothetical protein
MKFSMKTTFWSAALVLASVATTGEAWANKLLAPETGIYHGAFADLPDLAASSVVQQRTTQFETLAGKNIVWSILADHWLSGITFPAQRISAVHRAGRIPLVHLMPWSLRRRGFQADSIYTFNRMLSGYFDFEIRQWARDAKATRRPIIVDFAPEPNGDWYPWSGALNGGDETTGYGDPDLADGPEKYRDIYRRVVNIFKAEGASNVTFFFHVVSGNKPDLPWNTMSAYYPGDEFVDWIGVSVYSAQFRGDFWEDFSESMDVAYPELAALSADKPLAILELGIIEDENRSFRKADWIIDAFASLKEGRYPRVHGVSYWHESAWAVDGNNNMRIDSSQESLAAYRDEIADPLFLATPVLSGGGNPGGGDDTKCKCGITNTRYGQTCGVQRPQTQINAGQPRFLVESSANFTCGTEQQCLQNYGEYLRSASWCPNGWVLVND